MKHEYDDDVAWWFNQHVYEITDVDELIHEAITRALWFQGLWTYWARRVIDELAGDEAIRGPGILLVPSGYEVRNASFASASAVNEDFTDPTNDPARPLRVQSIPRIAEYGLLRNLLEGAYVWRQHAGGGPPYYSEADIGNRDGPLSLRRELNSEYVNGQQGGRIRLIPRLADEIDRIQHGMIASLAHPNTVGAKLYAAQAVASTSAIATLKLKPRDRLNRAHYRHLCS